jgi:trk system potassium uptake protein TrkA
MKEAVKYIIIIGCGRLGSELALELSLKHSVVVIDKNEESFERLANRNFTGFTMLVDINDMDVLKKMKLEKADMVYVVTPDEIMARANDPMKKEIFMREGMEIFCPIENSVSGLVKDFYEDDKQ